MSQKETTATIGRLEAGESQYGNLSELAELAREAFEQKRTKDCLDLTRAMLLVDPGNADAQSMRLYIQSEMHRDLDTARAFIRQAQNKESLEPQLQPNGTEIEGHLGEAEVETGYSRLWTHVSGAVALLSNTFNSRQVQGIRWLLVASALIAVGVVLTPLSRFKTNTNPVEPSLLALGSSDVSEPVVIEEVRPAQVETAANLAPATPTAPLKLAPRVATPEPSPAVVLADPPVVAGTGILAISSPGSVDIYEDASYLGSVPVSLELSAGEHTLEYRHGSLRKIVTHAINRNQTTKATVVFDVTVQVNSRPWSEVFLDGVERKDLGQTPLGAVRVPIGGVLIFENPQFQEKRYRVTGNETGIQVVFP
jgi:hypothetical protein